MTLADFTIVDRPASFCPQRGELSPLTQALLDTAQTGLAIRVPCTQETFRTIQLRISTNKKVINRRGFRVVTRSVNGVNGKTGLMAWVEPLAKKDGQS